MTCKNCECDECIDTRDKEYRQQEKEKYKAWCESWSYNARPLEIATQLKEVYKFEDIYKYDFQSFLETFEDYFGVSSRKNLEDICNCIF